MGVTDFIWKRDQAQRAPENESRGPETAKESHAKQAEQEKLMPTPEQKMSPEALATAKEIGDRVPQVRTDSSSLQAPAEIASSADGATNPQPQAQLLSGQDNVAPALSPTSAQRGLRPSDQEISRPSDTPKVEKTRTPPEQGLQR